MLANFRQPKYSFRPITITQSLCKLYDPPFVLFYSMLNCLEVPDKQRSPVAIVVASPKVIRPSLH